MSLATRAISRDEFEAKMKVVKSLLNKLTPEKFDRLLQQLFAVGINDERTLQGVIALIYDRAITQPKFCAMYAHACRT